MIQHTITRPHVAVTPHLHRTSRLFVLRWTNTRLRIRPDERYKRHECEGTHYANGLVTLDNGSVYDTLSELQHTLELAGTHEIIYQDEQEEKEHDA